MSKQIFGAQLSLRCCDTTAPDMMASPCWRLYVTLSGPASEWPMFTWPTSTEVPSVRARQAALACLGFALAEGAEWEWLESTSPEYHPHPVRVVLLGTAKVRPLESGAATAPGGAA